MSEQEDKDRLATIDCPVHGPDQKQDLLGSYLKEVHCAKCIKELLAMFDKIRDEPNCD